AQLAAQEQELQERIENLQAQRAAAEANCLPITDIKAARDRIALGMEKATFEERQWIVRTLVQRIVATKDEYVIEGVLPALNSRGTNEETARTGVIQDDAFVSAVHWRGRWPAERRTRRCGDDRDKGARSRPRAGPVPSRRGAGSPLAG